MEFSPAEIAYPFFLYERLIWSNHSARRRSRSAINANPNLIARDFFLPVATYLFYAWHIIFHVVHCMQLKRLGNRNSEGKEKNRTVTVQTAQSGESLCGVACGIPDSVSESFFKEHLGSIRTVSLIAWMAR